MSEVKIDVKTEEGMEGTSEEVNKYLTFDLVAPSVIQGHINDYDGSLYIVMNNGDQIDFDYEITPTNLCKSKYTMSINGSDDFDFPEITDHFGLYMREAYKQYLNYVLTFKKTPRAIYAQKASNGLGVKLVTY